MHPGRAWLGLLLAVLATTGAAAAQPLVQVRAESRVAVQTTRIDGGAAIEGTLRDDLGQPLADRIVVVELEPEDGTAARSGAAAATLRARTGSTGRFRVERRLAAPAYRLSVRFEGDDTHERVERERRLDFTRAEVDLGLELPEGDRIDLDRRNHVVVVQARSRAGGGGLEVQLLDEFDRPFASETTGPDGRGRFEVPVERLGPPGAGRVKARSAADATRVSAQTEVPVVRFRHTDLRLEAESSQRRIVLQGTLRDSAGPIEGRAVGLYGRRGKDREAHVATVLTDARGRFRHELDLRDWETGSATFQARFRSDAPGRTDSRSDPVRVRIAAGPQVWPWLLLPIALCALALGWLARRHTAEVPARASASAISRKPGIEAAARRTRRADRTDLGGAVIDSRDDEPVNGAMATLVGKTGGAIPVPVSPTGRFHASRIEPGQWTLRIEAEGYLPAEATVIVPHRGEWSGMEVRLESWRARALAPFRRVALALLGSSRLWGLRTNREVVDQAIQSGRGGDHLPELAGRVERACYAAEPPTRSDVEAIERQAEAAIDDLGRS